MLIVCTVRIGAALSSLISVQYYVVRPVDDVYARVRSLLPPHAPSPNETETSLQVVLNQCRRLVKQTGGQTEAFHRTRSLRAGGKAIMWGLSQRRAALRRRPRPVLEVSALTHNRPRPAGAASEARSESTT